MEKQQFVKSILYATQLQLPTALPKTLHMVAAHAAYESGYGISKAYKKGNNLFNITRLPSDPAPIIYGGDLEYSADGKIKNIIQRFAAYKDIGESISHYLNFIGRKRYWPALPKLLEGKVDEFLAALFKGGYFTLPLDRYTSRYKAVLKEIERLA